MQAPSSKLRPTASSGDSTAALFEVARDAYLYACRQTNSLDKYDQCLQCDHQKSPLASSTVSTSQWIHLLFIFSSSSEPALRCGFMKATIRLLRHAPSEELDLTQGSVGRACLQAFQSSLRPLRVLAGQAIEIFCDPSKSNAALASQNTSVLLEITEKWFWRSSTPLATQATTVEHLAAILRLEADPIILNFLLRSMTITSALLRSLIIAQLGKLARLYKKTTYQLVLPVWECIADGLLIQASIDQSYLRSVCELLSMPPAMVIQRSLEWILPKAISTFPADSKSILDSIAALLNAHVPELCVENLHHILASIFLLDSSKAGASLLALLDLISSGGIRIQLPQLIKSCALLLVNKLVSTLSNPDVKPQAIKALEIVAANVEDTDKPNLSQFLRHHILGIMTHINDVINDTHGRTTTNVRAQTIGAVNEFILIIGKDIVTVMPQILATLQTAHEKDELRCACIEAWCTLLRTIPIAEAAPVLGQSISIMVKAWEKLSTRERRLLYNLLYYFVIENGDDPCMKDALADICFLPRDPDLIDIRRRLSASLDGDFLFVRLPRLLRLLSHDLPALRLSVMQEIKLGIVENQINLTSHILGERISPDINSLVNLLVEYIREDEADVVAVCCDCLGALGAIDPNRLEQRPPTTLTIFSDFSTRDASRRFAMSLILDHLIGAFRSSKDTKSQDALAYAIQELLKFCGYNKQTIKGSGSMAAKWKALPRTALDLIAPLLNSRYKVKPTAYKPGQKPFFSFTGTYRDWLQAWVLDLIEGCDGDHAREVFEACRTVIKTSNLSIAELLLPHLILHALTTETLAKRDAICLEILTVIQSSGEQTEKTYLALQKIFDVLDFLGHWLRNRRQAAHAGRAARAKQANRHMNPEDDVEDERDTALVQIEETLQKFPQESIAEASLRTKSYTRALLHQEQHIRSLGSGLLQEEYAKLQRIYANLDEPDGMQGISMKFISPSLEQEILEHQSTGKWAAAQSCFELSLQREPDNLGHHIGLLNCLQHLGHYDTMLTQIGGLLAIHPEWQSQLAPLGLEASWLAGDWQQLTHILQKAPRNSFESSLATALIRLRQGERAETLQSLQEAQRSVAEKLATSSSSYQYAYDHVVKLHLISEIKNAVQSGNSDVTDQRLLITLPIFKVREPILNMRRIISISTGNDNISPLWLQSAKLARKAGLYQTAYAAILRASPLDAGTRIERAKWAWANGESQSALYELRNILALDELSHNQSSLKSNDAGSGLSFGKAISGKVRLLYAGFLDKTRQSQSNAITLEYKKVCKLLPNDEKAFYRLGRHFDGIYKASRSDRKSKKGSVAPFVIKNYLSALTKGTKYFYQAMPRMLTVWLDLGATCIAMQQSSVNGDNHEWDNIRQATDSVNALLQQQYQNITAYQWIAVLSQILSRLNHKHDGVYEVLEAIVTLVIQIYPHEALWHVMPVCRSTSDSRRTRCNQILSKVKTTPRETARDVSQLIDQTHNLTNLLIALCDSKVAERQTSLTMSRDFRQLAKLGPLKTIVPQQSALNVMLPSTVASTEGHKPFPDSPATLRGFGEDIEILNSLQKPRKISMIGSDGKHYTFLCKPKDDLRKDNRLMEFNGVINKILKKAPVARARHLYIRTYAVVPLDEECGLIEWVPSTTTLRHILIKFYKSKNIPPGGAQAKTLLESHRDPRKAFVQDVLPMYPPVFHEWFLETFPDPSSWFRSRLAYSRTAAVMSMIGYIVGLGDRHGENILLDESSGDCVHVDFNCLFEKGITFTVPERVPFRLTQNMIDAFGVTGYEGVFRKACQTTLGITRQNQDSLMSILEAFIHDPLVEWNDRGDESSHHTNKRNASKSHAEDAVISRRAYKAFDTIKAKLQGLHSASTPSGLALSIEGSVQELISEATDANNLSRMYVGWTAWY